jgi:hypothetical protein
MNAGEALAPRKTHRRSALLQQTPCLWSPQHHINVIDVILPAPGVLAVIHPIAPHRQV